MSTTGSSPLSLVKPESNDVVDLAVINTNYDTINTFAANTNTDLATKATQISTLNTAVGAGGTVQNAVKATGIAGGAQKRIPIQSAADTTTFIAVPTGGGKLLASSLSAPYADWTDPVPYKIQTGSTTVTGSGTVTFNTAFDFAPIITATASAASTARIVTVTSPSTTGFTVKVWDVSGSAATVGVTIYWTAIQYSSSSSSS